MQSNVAGSQSRTQGRHLGIRAPISMDGLEMIPNVLDAAVIPKLDHRPIRTMHTPTGPSFLSSGSLAHDTVIVGDPRNRDGVLQSQLLRNKGDSTVRQETKFRVQLPRSSVKTLIKGRVIKYTRMTDEEILREAQQLIAGFGTYDVLSRNCQHFSSRLIEAIADTTIVEPDPNAEYRFTLDALLFTGVYGIPGKHSDFIFPKETSVIINVTETDEPETWQGEVRGTKERGKFLRRFVERVS